MIPMKKSKKEYERKSSYDSFRNNTKKINNL